MTEEQAARLFGDVTIAQGVLWVLAAAALLWLAVRAWPWLVRFVALVNALGDLPSKLALVDEIHKEVRPNHGSSLNDAVRRVEVVQRHQTEQLNEHSQKLTGLQELMEAGDADLSERVEDLENTLQPSKEKPC